MSHIHRGWRAKLLIDEDLSASADAMRALADLQESLTAFQKLCVA